MNLSVAVSQNWGIGYKNDLLFRISEDLKRFRKLTTGKTIIMGHNTFKSLPGGKPLPNRTNIVLSRDTTLKIPDVIVCNSVEELQKHLHNDVFIIGGEQVYRLLLDYCKTAYVTQVQATPPADAFMPNLNELPNWKLIEEESPKTDGRLVYKYSTYVNQKN
ncbi:MAG: dihydrofolate reductase [Defluviitaleaceae bacterium]|nr:dihydrofolate reductase [Defluviitaleaceae bacterium]